MYVRRSYIPSRRAIIGSPPYPHKVQISSKNLHTACFDTLSCLLHVTLPTSLPSSLFLPRPSFLVLCDERPCLSMHISRTASSMVLHLFRPHSHTARHDLRRMTSRRWAIFRSSMFGSTQEVPVGEVASGVCHRSRATVARTATLTIDWSFLVYSRFLLWFRK